MVARIVLTFSLLLAVCGSAWAQSFSQIEQQLANVKPVEAKRLLAPYQGTKDKEFASILHQFRAGELTAEEVRDYAGLRALGEGGSTAPKPGAGRAKEIKKSPFYTDQGAESETNWLGKALKKLIDRLTMPRMENPNLPAPQGNFSFLINIVWGILAVLALGFAYYAISSIRLSRQMWRKSSALLEEDEPQLTLDEWLAEADRLAADGKHREAVRALYLACLLRFDEHRVARFVRGQTNWEHLERIEASANRPEGLSFREPTRAFDRIWYGMRVRGLEDVAQFREWYQEVTRRLSEVRK